MKAKFYHPLFDMIYEDYLGFKENPNDYKDVNSKEIERIITLGNLLTTDENDNRPYVLLPVVMEICPQCQGFGTCTRTDIDDSKLIDSMLEDGDYEGIDGYYKGEYDITCPCCNGHNVVQEFDWHDMPTPLNLELIQWSKDEEQNRKEEMQERCMGA